MFIQHADAGGVSYSPLTTHSDVDDLRREVQQINTTNAHTPDPDPNKKTDPEKSDFDKLLEVLTGFLGSNEAANLLAQQNATNANIFEAEEAEKARKWSEHLSDTYWQRQVKDLEAAGLNKWMAIYGSGGPGIPSAAQAHATNADTFKRQENIVDTIVSIAALVGTLIKSLTGSNTKLGDAFLDVVDATFNQDWQSSHYVERNGMKHPAI